MSFVCDGTSWQILTQDGTDGQDGLSINWLGELNYVPQNPSVNDAYYNFAEDIACIWDDSWWDILAQGASSGTCNPAPANGLVAYYPFNGNANDESGNLNHGTVNGAAVLIPTGLVILIVLIVDIIN